MIFVVLEPIEVLVPLAADVAAVGFMFFHAEGAGVGVQGFGINDAESAVVVGGELLGIVAVLLGRERD